MTILLIGRTKIYRTYLPINISGNYWINDTMGNKLLNIEATDKGWQIASNNFVKIVYPNSIKIENERMITKANEDNIISTIIIKENNMYTLCLGDSKEVYILYCTSEKENKLQHMNFINTQKITIGSGKENNIIYNNPFISDKHAEIVNEGGKWIITNYNMYCGTFVNNEPIYEDRKTLFNGDIVFIMGLKIILLRNSIYINNPQNNVIVDNKYFKLSEEENEPIKKEDNNDLNVDVIVKENYYNRSPRMLNLIKTEEVKIDEPPSRSDGTQKPTLLLLGSSLAMGIVAVLSLSTAIQGLVNGTATFASTFVSFMYAILMIVAMIVIPLLNIKYDKKTKEKLERKRQKRYKAYIDKKQEIIEEIKSKQREKLYKNNLSAEECENIVLTNNHRLWERKIDEDDFLTVRLGIGEMPLNIDIKYPEEKFTLEDDNLLDMVRNLVDNSKTIDDAPITVSLLQNKIISIIEKNTTLFTDLFMKNIILQLVTMQSYEDLNLVFLVKDSQRWEYTKMLPHIWNASKQIRFFADNYYDMNEVSKFLEDELKKRSASEENSHKNTIKKPHYLIITDDYQQIENLKAIVEILKTKGEYGFTLLCITDDIFKLPNECEMFIAINRYGGTLFENKNSFETQKEFTLDNFYDIRYNVIVQKLANIPIKMKDTEKTAMLPTNYSFLEMFEVGNIESLNILDRWKSNDSTMSLRTPIGIDENGRIVSLDIHEKYHGPHGLVAGSTGSGKSEFIITYILSLAINYHPDDVNFLLIDYKGGGLAGAFETEDYRLPHLVGTITNIDTNGLQRSLISIQSELKRRQILFNEARNITNEGTIDIYKYQRLYHEGVVKKPIPHLLIICDEFAELKQQQQEFMDELISVSRIGRSLGVHLILATQKPAGIVNDQIRSNSKFAVCLKVQDRSDSQDVIKKADAAFLKNTGQFYLQVGNDEYFVLGQAAWAGAQYVPSNTIQKKVDTSVEFISNIGEPIKRIDDVPKQNVNSQGEQLTNIVKYISDLANKENLEKENNLWLEDIPQDIYISDLRVKYNVKNKGNAIEAVIGEYDDPSNQKQGLVKVNLYDKENINVYGNAESGKETLLSTMIYDLITNYNPEEIQFYILDFGSEVLKIFKNSPHVGDVIFSRDEEKVDRFFDMIRSQIKERRHVLSDYNGDYNLYISKGNSMPIIMIVLNNYEVFQENYGVKYDDIFSAITRDCTKYGIIFATTVNSSMSMRYRLTQNFTKKLVLQLSNPDEYVNIFSKIRRKKPTNIFGRGLAELGNNNEVLEFQTARICGHKDFNVHITDTIKKLQKMTDIKAKPIPVIPKVLPMADVADKLKDITTVPLGIRNKNLSVYTYNFKENFTTLLISRNMKDAIDFAYIIMEEVKSLDNVDIIVLDAEEIKKDKTVSLKEAFDKTKAKIEKEMGNKKGKFILCVLIGINRFLSSDAITDTDLDAFMKDAEKSEKVSFIIIDNPALLKNNEYSQWYKEFIQKDYGIWVGNGITEQYVISNNISSFAKKTDYNTSFGYVVKEREATLIKLIEMKDRTD